MKRLPFEKPLTELLDKIDQLKALAQSEGIDLSAEIAKIEERATIVRQELYANLTPIDVVQIARHPNRPDALSLAMMITEDWTELHGDRQFGDDPSIIGGVGRLGAHRVVVIGHQKGHDTKENLYRNFGMPHPEGYRKALRLMTLANQFQMPIITFIDTPGAYPGLTAEERGQAEAIARNLKVMAGLEVPIVSVVIGEGGSGGALGIGLSNRLFMMQYAVYSVISPEGCASILFRDAKKADVAAKALRITAPDIMSMGICHGILPEPLGGAHHDWQAVASTIQSQLTQTLDQYGGWTPDQYVAERWEHFRKLGPFIENGEPANMPSFC